MSSLASTVLSIMWSLWIVVMLFVIMRLYTRIWIVKSPGWDDYTYCLSAALLLIYTVCTHVASKHGCGKDYHTLAVQDQVFSVEWVMIAETFAIIGMSVAKTSLGLFLLRLVVVQWHRKAIITVLVGLFISSSIACTVLWIQCLPSESIYDHRVKGKYIIPTVAPFAILLGTICVVADLFFAGFPWLSIWTLNMNQRDKVTIAGSMSFGIVDAACSIVRTIECRKFSDDNFTKNTVGIVVWSSAEIAITLICMGIPVMRQFIHRVLLKQSGSSSGAPYKKQGQGIDGISDNFALETIGGSKMVGHLDDRGFPHAPLKLGIRGPTTKTRVSSTPINSRSSNEIDGDRFRDQSARVLNSDIQVEAEVTVEYEKQRKYGSFIPA